MSVKVKILFSNRIKLSDEQIQEKRTQALIKGDDFTDEDKIEFKNEWIESEIFDMYLATVAFITITNDKLLGKYIFIENEQSGELKVKYDETVYEELKTRIDRIQSKIYKMQDFV